MPVVKYILSQLDKTGAWVGIIGMVLLFINAHSLLFFLFVLLIVLPEQNFSEIFKKWTVYVRSTIKD